MSEDRSDKFVTRDGEGVDFDPPEDVEPGYRDPDEDDEGDEDEDEDEKDEEAD